MLQGPLVSVLMTSYNRERYIAEAIESVLSSTYENFELIIVDDRSKDSTVAIAKKYAEMDHRVKVFINEENLGDYPNRNKAASYAQGKYIKYVDADDCIYPQGLETLVKMMEAFPDSGWGICTLPPNNKQPYPLLLSPKGAYEYHYSGPGLFHRAPLSAIIKKEVFDKVGGFGHIRMAGDYEMWHRLGQSYPVVLMPEGIIWYRTHDAQEMNDHGKYLEVYWNIRKKYLADANCPLEKSQVEVITKQIRIRIFKQILKAAVGAKFSTIRVKLKEYKTQFG